MALPQCTHHVARGIVVLTTLLLVIFILIPSIGGFNASSLYAWHPVAMVVGIVGFASLGLTAYVSDYGTTVSGVPTQVWHV